MSDDFDMPASGSWAIRGGWVVRRLAADLGLTLAQAAGMVGNLGFESNGFATLHEVGQPVGLGGYGWAQWTDTRRDDFLDWCEANKLDWQSDKANYGYLLVELRGNYKNVVAKLKQTGTVEEATWSVGQSYERPGGTTSSFLPGYDDRLQRAKEALLGASGGTPVPAPDQVAAAVRVLQTALQLGGFYKGAIDGDFGEQSLKALAAYRHR